MNKSGAKSKAGRESTQSPAPLHAVGGEVSDTGSMDKIRDILFGHQMRDYEKRFLRMEKQLHKEISETQDSNRKRLETFETYFKKELAVLKERLQAEIDDRADSEKKSQREFSDATSSLSKKISKLEETLTAHATDLHDQLLTQSKNLSADMDQKFEKTTQDTREAIQDLSHIKADRSTLAELFMQFAMQLSDEQNHELEAPKQK